MQKRIPITELASVNIETVNKNDLVDVSGFIFDNTIPQEQRAARVLEMVKNLILKNRLYIGDMVQGHQRVKSYKIHTREQVPENEWFIVENTHEPIIEREIYERVQQLLQLDTRTAPQQKKLHLFSGFLRCADCGKAMARSKSKNTVYYFCRTYKDQSKTVCTKHSVKHNQMEVAVLYAIQQYVYLAVYYSKIIAEINTAPLQKSQSVRLDGLIEAKEKELAKIMRYKQAIYQDWKDGEITHSDYRHISEDYERQIKAISAGYRQSDRRVGRVGMIRKPPF